MKSLLNGIAPPLSILVAAIMLGAEASPLPPEPVGLHRVLVGDLHNVGELIKSRAGKYDPQKPPGVVRAYLDDMFWRTTNICWTMEALDPLCRAYPQTDNQWRKESFLPY